MKHAAAFAFVPFLLVLVPLACGTGATGSAPDVPAPDPGALADVAPGPNTVTYRALFQGKDYVPVPAAQPQGFGARLDVNTYLVVWE